MDRASGILTRGNLSRNILSGGNLSRYILSSVVAEEKSVHNSEKSGKSLKILTFSVKLSKKWEKIGEKSGENRE